MVGAGAGGGAIVASTGIAGTAIVAGGGIGIAATGLAIAQQATSKLEFQRRRNAIAARLNSEAISPL